MIIAGFSGFRDCKHWLLAVSGGPDSVALLSLALAWRDAHPVASVRISAVTVDHGLRAAAATEAADVARLCARFGVPHATLRWMEAAPMSNIQAMAREARYKLLARHAVSIGAAVVLLGHHADDQAETLVLRLARGSSVDGLAGMRASVRLNGVLFGRPLLDIAKSELVTHLTGQGLSWADDPSNSDRRFDRVRVRQAMSDLADLGLTRDRLMQTARQMARASDALDHHATDVLHRGALLCNALGAVALDPVCFAATMAETRLRILRRIVLCVRPAAYPPRLAKLEALDDAVLTLHERGSGHLRRTLQGVVFDGTTGGLMAYAEAGRNDFPTETVRGPESVCWDGRCDVSLTDFDWRRHGDQGPLHIGAAGLTEVPKTLNPPIDLTIPLSNAILRRAIANAPHLFAGNTVVAGPAMEARAGSWHVNPCCSRFAVKMTGAGRFDPDPVD